jgi:E3 ubiquitin-protein ligase UBR1
MPVTRKYVFTPSTRAEILSELYDALWGPYSHLFLPKSSSSLPLHATLADVQARLNFAGAALNDPPVPGRPCGYIFKKGESCFRCKWVMQIYAFLAEIGLTTGLQGLRP